MNQFRHHYTRDEARALLPQVQLWLDRLVSLRDDLERYDERLTGLLSPGCDMGGELVNTWVKTMAGIKQTVAEFSTRDIQIKDLDRGLIDFPAIIGGREVFLCWEHGEDDIEYWHDLDAGYAGREPFSGTD